MKLQGFGLVHGLPKKKGKKMFDLKCKVMKVEMVLKNVGIKKMVPKHMLFKYIFLHIQKLNCREGVYELENHVG
jgi:hypothetical protein